MGAVVSVGVITLFKNFSVITASLRNVMNTLRSHRIKTTLRTDQDLPIGVVVIGAPLLVVLIAVLPHLTGTFPVSLLLCVIIPLCGFFFVTVSSRFVGVVGYTVEPVSSMMFTTVMATCLLFVVLGLTSEAAQLTVVLVGAIVGVAAGISGATSQDLKTGTALRRRRYWLY